VKLAIVAVVLLGCSEKDKPEVPREHERPHRVIEPPLGTMRSLPPHPIRADSVGPYRIGERLDVLLGELPSGPRISTFDIRGVVHANVIHAEDDTVLIGGEPGATASFIAVIGSEVARTESGVHVGSTKDELARALGSLVVDVDRARDPRVVVPNGLRSARVVADGDRIAAFVVTADPSPPRPRDGVDCARPAVEPPKLGACLAAGEIVEVDGDDIVVRAADRAEDKPVATAKVSGLVFAAPLRNLAENKDELVVVSRIDDAQSRTWSISVFQLEKKGLVRTIDATPLYQLSSANARWIGADLKDVDVYAEITSHSDAIEVGGLLTTRSGDKIRDVVVIAPVMVPRRHDKSAKVEAGESNSEGSATGRSRP
jgi:hypothetical protein